MNRVEAWAAGELRTRELLSKQTIDDADDHGVFLKLLAVMLSCIQGGTVAPAAEANVC